MLKANFPNVKFSLTKRNYDTLNINYTDGINAKFIESIIDKFEGKSFDGMTDSESFTKAHNNFNVGYIFVNRHISNDYYKEVYNQYVKNHYNGEVFEQDFNDFISDRFGKNDYCGFGISPENVIYRTIQANNL